MGEKKPRVNMTMRLRVLTALFLVIGFGLVGVRLLYMQVFHHDFYIQKATSLQTRDTFITPNRGKIYDANMQVLAESAAVERITISPKAVVDEDKVKKGISAETQQQTLAQILSVEMMLRYSFDMNDAADDIRRAVTNLLNDGWRTGDLKDATTPADKVVNCAGMGDLVVKYL